MVQTFMAAVFCRNSITATENRLFKNNLKAQLFGHPQHVLVNVPVYTVATVYLSSLKAAACASPGGLLVVFTPLGFKAEDGERG